MKIGSIKISSNPVLALAPMAGYTDIALRELMAKTGADITYSELASATAISREKDSNVSKTASIIKTHRQKVSAVQLFGASQKEIAYAIKHVCSQINSGNSYAKFIDINLGCPAPKVTKTGSGSQLLHNPTQLKKIAKAAIKHSTVPITAKLRLLPKLDDTIKIAKILQKENFSALAFHGRTQKQKYGGNSNWNAIKKIKENLDIPIIANGDIKTPQNVKECLELTKCDAAMIGRAALRNPLIFKQTKQFYKNKSLAKTTLNDKINFLKKYITLSKKHTCQFIYTKEIAMQFASGFAGAAHLREKISKSKNQKELISYFESLQ